jgi:hypothetical protein
MNNVYAPDVCFHTTYKHTLYNSLIRTGCIRSIYVSNRKEYTYAFMNMATLSGTYLRRAPLIVDAELFRKDGYLRDLKIAGEFCGRVKNKPVYTQPFNEFLDNNWNCLLLDEV